MHMYRCADEVAMGDGGVTRDPWEVCFCSEGRYEAACGGGMGGWAADVIADPQQADSDGDPREDVREIEAGWQAEDVWLPWCMVSARAAGGALPQRAGPRHRPARSIPLRASRLRGRLRGCDWSAARSA